MFSAQPHPGLMNRICLLMRIPGDLITHKNFRSTGLQPDARQLSEGVGHVCQVQSKKALCSASLRNHSLQTWEVLCSQLVCKVFGFINLSLIYYSFSMLPFHPQPRRIYLYILRRSTRSRSSCLVKMF